MLASNVRERIVPAFCHRFWKPTKAGCGTWRSWSSVFAQA
jgi:hypothetical protein